MSNFTPSPQQQAIFDEFATGKSNVVVTARAGCGKTTTILRAIDFAPEKKILLAAFNKDIAQELKSRLSNENAQARTLHSLGNGYVFSKWGKVAIDPKRGMLLAQKAIGGNPKKEHTSLVAKLASVAKNLNADPTIEELVEMAYDYNVMPESSADADIDLDAAIHWIAKKARKALELATRKDGTIDYDDMVFLPVRCNWAYPRFDLVVIDEAQDMNPLQLELARRACRRNGRITAIGDNRQAIYGFRGADSGALARLAQELDAKQLTLTTTYRCPKKVVALAAALVPDFEAADSAPEGVVDTVGPQTIQEAVPGNFVLSRKNAPLAGVCLSLLREGKRAFIRGRDIGASLISIIKRTKTTTVAELATAIETWRVNMLEKLAAEEAPDAAFERVEDQAETISTLAEGLATTAEVIARIDSLFSDSGLDTAIVCSTIHRAKGLEAERVFLLVNTLYPGRTKNQRDTGEGEEANIEYVGITRAKNHLSLVQGIG